MLIHDHDITFYHYAKDHQECVVHILRYLIGSTENEPELTWAKQMHDLMEEMLDDAYKHTLTPEKSEAYKKRYDEILDIADQEYAGVSKTKAKSILSFISARGKPTFSGPNAISSSTIEATVWLSGF